MRARSACNITSAAPRAALLRAVIAALTMGSMGAAPADWAAFDDLWPRRDDPAVAAKLQSQATEFAASSSYEELWRAASWYVWLATDDRPGVDLRGAAVAGRRAGELALAQQPQGIEALYWTALSVGLYASVVKPLEALSLGLSAHFRDPLLSVGLADPNLENRRVESVGAEVALAAYFEHLPWPAQDRRRAHELLSRALRSHPENLRARYLLAELLVDEDPAGAVRELEAVCVGDEAYDPPDARRQKRKACALLGRLR
jgi:hypothetical protein